METMNNNIELVVGTFQEIIKVANLRACRAVGMVAFGVNGEIVLLDSKIVCYGALDQAKKEELCAQPTQDAFLRYIKAQGYRLSPNSRVNIKRN